MTSRDDEGEEGYTRGAPMQDESIQLQRSDFPTSRRRRDTDDYRRAATIMDDSETHHGSSQSPNLSALEGAPSSVQLSQLQVESWTSVSETAAGRKTAALETSSRQRLRVTRSHTVAGGTNQSLPERDGANNKSLTTRSLHGHSRTGRIHRSKQLDGSSAGSSIFHNSYHNNNSHDDHNNNNDSASSMAWADGSLTSSFQSSSFRSFKSDLTVKFKAKNFIESHQGSPVEETYVIGKLIGQGGFGEVYVAYHIESGDERAVKVMAKHPEQERNDKIIKEFNIVKDLDHPNILKAYELFSSEDKFYIVTDIYRGGELYDELEQCGCFSEEDTSVVMKHMLSCVNYLHKSKHLVHGDLKLENILLGGNAEGKYDGIMLEHLKIIDFGMATKFEEGQRLTDMKGSIYYMAPQQLQGSYTSKCDIWSCGVIAYVCLSGISPFDGETDEDVRQQVLHGEYDFDDPAWDFVSDDAIDFVSSLLEYNEEDRPTAEEALQHPFLKFRQHETVYNGKQTESTRVSFTSMQNFRANSKLKQAVCSLIASQFLSEAEKEGIDSAFRSLDVNCDGRLSRKDIQESYSTLFGRDISDEEISSLFRQVNFSGSGEIEYSEFAVAALLENKQVDDKKLKAAFAIFDKKKEGYISAESIKEVLGFEDDLEEYIVNRIIREVDADGDGLISFPEFKDMLLTNRSIKTTENAIRKHRSRRRRRRGEGQEPEEFQISLVSITTTTNDGTLRGEDFPDGDSVSSFSSVFSRLTRASRGKGTGSAVSTVA